MARVTTPVSARDRILATARALFYEQGLRAVGVDLLIARSGVAKATFYKHFPSKDALIVAYLEQMDAQRMEALQSGATGAGPKPADQLAGAFDALVTIASAKGYRGCPFINAAAEYSVGTPAHACVTRHRDARMAWFADLAEIAGAAEPAVLAQELSLLMDGALAAGSMAPKDPAPALLAAAEARRAVKRATKDGRKGGGKSASAKKKSA